MSSQCEGVGVDYPCYVTERGVLACVTGCYRGEGGIQKVLILRYVIFEQPLPHSELTRWAHIVSLLGALLECAAHTVSLPWAIRKINR